MSVDAETNGNNATALGAHDLCVPALPGGTVTIDVTALGIPPYDDGGTPSNSADDSGGIIGYTYDLLFDGANLAVAAQDPNFLLAVNTSSSLFTGGSDAVPDTDGSFLVTVLDSGTAVPESGDGVLDRLSISVNSSASGIFMLTLTGAGHVDAAGGAAHLPQISEAGPSPSERTARVHRRTIATPTAC